MYYGYVIINSSWSLLLNLHVCTDAGTDIIHCYHFLSVIHFEMTLNKVFFPGCAIKCSYADNFLTCESESTIIKCHRNSLFCVCRMVV